MIAEGTLFGVTALVFVVSACLAAYFIGQRILALAGVVCANIAEEIAYSVGMGLGIIGLVILGFGLHGMLRPVPLSGGLVLLLALSAPVAVLAVRRIRTSGSLLWRVASVTALLALLFLPLLLLPLYPPTASDAITYHLAAAKQYAATGTVSPTPHLRYAVFPQLLEVLFAGAMLCAGDAGAQLVSFLFLLVNAFAIAGHLRQAAGLSAALIGVALFVSSSSILLLGTVAYVDVPLTAFITLALCALARWYAASERRWLLLAGGFLGFAVGTKYSALFFALVCFLIVGIVAYRRGKLGTVVMFLIPCIITGAPWYLYNWYHTGNPVWPFFSNLFGLAFWNQDDLQGQLADLVHRHGTGTGVLSLLQLPWNIFFQGDRFHPTGSFSWSLALTVPASLYAVIADRSTRASAVVVAGYILFWFFTAQILRYLLPVVPLLCGIGATGVTLFFRRLVGESFGHNTGAALLIALVLAAPGWLWSVKEVNMRGTLPMSRQARHAYLTRKLPSYGAVIAGNNAYPGLTLYAYGDPLMAYYASGEFRGDVFGPWRYSRLKDRLLGNEEALLHELTTMGARTLLVRDDPSGSDCPVEWLERRHVVPVYRSPGVALFFVSDSSRRAVLGVERLTTSRQALDSLAAAGLPFAADQESLYVCICECSSGSEAVTAILQIVWYRSDGALLRRDEATGAVLPGGAVLRLLATPPPGAARGVVFCTPLGSPGLAVRTLSVRPLRFTPSLL